MIVRHIHLDHKRNVSHVAPTTLVNRELEEINIRHRDQLAKPSVIVAVRAIAQYQIGAVRRLDIPANLIGIHRQMCQASDQASTKQGEKTLSGQTAKAKKPRLISGAWITERLAL
jgi:hypothetical protein